MADDLDLDAYFARIGYDGDARPTLETLARLHALHAEAIPFENLSVFLREDVPLDLASLQAKLVAAGRGGWCFEHNLLFTHVLRGLGFTITTLAARVIWTAAPNEVRPRSHMLMQVRLPDGDHIADVGFGGLGLTEPLRLPGDVGQQTEHDPFRLTQPSRGNYLLEARVAADWENLYVFDLYERELPDYEVSNWYLANHPKSYFVNGIMAARAEPGARHALRNLRHAIHRPGLPSESRAIESVDELRKTLSGPFRIRLPETPELDRRFAGLFADPP